MPKTCIAAVLPLVVGIIFASATQAAPVFFLLGDHPDSRMYNGTPDTAYGLRLDHFDTTYSVGDNLGGFGGPLYLTYDPDDLAAGARIFGTIDRNTESGPGVKFDVEYLLFGLSAFAEGFRATDGNGTIQAIDPCIVDCSFDLVGKRNHNGYAFGWNNRGYRLPVDTGWVATGWLEGDGGFNDWLVTGVPTPPPPGEEIPEPGTIGLMLIGLGMLAGGRKFRNRKED